MMRTVPVVRIVAEILLPAGEGPASLLVADLPTANVAAEEGNIAAAGNERLQVVAHRAGPVLVMPNREHQPVLFE